uniref:TF-B3 domain-containing protein n=1 Tax=Kalanchoe fedtschenkoi TaxID=63787 RepID=A0A7N0TT61_KALFE
MVMEKMRDLSLIDFVGLEEGKLPSTDDPVDVLAFVSAFASMRLSELEKALAKRAEPGCKQPARGRAARGEHRPVSRTDAPPKKKNKQVKEASPVKADQEQTTGAAGRVKGAMVIRFHVRKSHSLEGAKVSSSGLLAVQESTDGAQTHGGGKKKKRPAETRTEIIKKKPRLVAASAAAGPHPPPDLPDNFREMIERMGGVNPVLVIQKGLFQSDLKPDQNRLSIPERAIKNKFLKEEEEELLATREDGKPCSQIDTTMIDTVGEVWSKVPVRRWVMRKQNGAQGTIMYVLNDPWIKLASKNNLNAGDVVQLWAFRVDERLCLALVKL